MVDISLSTFPVKFYVASPPDPVTKIVSFAAATFLRDANGNYVKDPNWGITQYADDGSVNRDATGRSYTLYSLPDKSTQLA